MPDFSPPPLEVVLCFGGEIVGRCPLAGGRYLIGQDAECELVALAPPLSPKHARLTVVDEEQFFIEDLESATGTFVDQRPAEGITPVRLDSLVQLGEATLEFRRAGLPLAVFEYLPEGFLSTTRYEFGEIIVQGSTSTIYAARETTIGRDVALKMMLPESQSDPQLVLRFVRDAQIAGQLQHSSILPIYELGVSEQSALFFTTRFVEGEPLSAILEGLAAADEAALHTWTLAALLVVFQKVCDALAYAHAHGVVHCALRPEAITVGGFGEVFVTDWSFARAVALEEETGLPQIQAGAPFVEPAVSPFSSPEQAEGAFEDLEPRTDVHALGGLLYKILTLVDPLEGGTETELLEQALSARVIAPAERTRTVVLPHWPSGKLPEPLVATAMKALHANRFERHASVLALQREIAAWQHGSAAEIGRRWKQFTGLMGKR